MSGLDTDICWMCEDRPSETREHRVLKARLDLIQGRENGFVATSPNYRPTVIRGTKSNVAKFGRTMCQICNGHLSQPWDRAYLDFVKRGLADPNLYRGVTSIGWSKLFPAHLGPIPNLSRYYAKNIGCRLIDSGQKVPQQLISYLNSNTDVPPFSLFLVEEYAWLDEIERLLDNRWDYPTLKSNYSISLANDSSPELVVGLFHEGPYAVVFLMDSMLGPVHNFAHEATFQVNSRSTLPRETSRLWVVVDEHIERLQELEKAGRLKEVINSSDFLNLLSTHDM